MHMVDAIVRKTGEQLSESGRILQEILAAGADENGEWLLPLAPDQVERMRKVRCWAPASPRGLVAVGKIQRGE
jgi:glutathione S-transferase